MSPAAASEIADLAGGLCGIHAQVMASAELSLGLRIRGFTRADLSTALWKTRTLVKTYGPRGTVHLLPAREYGLWLAALRDTGRAEADPARMRYLGITPRDLESLIEATALALGPEPITREELGQAVAKRVGRWAVDLTVGAFGGVWPVWTVGIGAAARRGLLCFGPPDGAKVTFVEPRSWLGPFAVPDARDAQRELMRRFLHAYGPVTHAEFAQWATIAPARAKEIASELGAEIETVDVEGTCVWQLTGDRFPAPRSSTLIVPRFDCYLVGGHPRDVVIPPAVVQRAAATGILPKASGTGRAFLVGPMPVVLFDGVVAGIWGSTRTAKRIAIVVQPFVPLPAARRVALERASQRIGAIVGLDAEMTLGSVRTRPHL